MNQLSSNRSGPPAKSFRLDRSNGKIWGVCGGIANYFGIDPMLVRIGFAGSGKAVNSFQELFPVFFIGKRSSSGSDN